jgi:hypothetical protein
MASKFRDMSLHQQQGHEAGRIVQGKVTNYNLTKWTVDIVGQFDRTRYFNIQVSSPYLHHSNGEGMYVIPEVNATVMVCIPSDSAAPFVICFVMAAETVDASAPDAPQGTSSHGAPAANPTDSSYAGGRPPANPGDIWLRTRDNNFVVLRRGGVLQVGATQLAQRIYIPLNNQIIDISQNYEHNNAGGTVAWGIQTGPSITQYPATFMQTFRVFANDAAADIKVASGYVTNPIPEPDGGVNLATAGVGAGDDGKGSNPIVYEVTVSPKGFNTQTGEALSGAGAASVMKFTFDRQGNGLTRFAGNFYFQVTEALTFDVAGNITMKSGDSTSMTAVNGFDIDGGAYTAIKGKVVRLGAGTLPVVRQGDVVKTELTPATQLIAVAPALQVVVTFETVPAPNTPCTGTMQIAGGVLGLTGTLNGSNVGGNPDVLA